MLNTPIEVVSACAIDSTGKRWRVPSKKLKSLNARGPATVVRIG